MVNNDAKRLVPSLPPAGKPIRILIDSDAAAEIDDQHAIALALLSPERFRVEGFIGTHFGDYGGSEGARKSVVEIRTVLEKAGMPDRYPVLRGADPLAYITRPTHAPGVDFLIERALAGDDDDPLWILGLGAATNIASAWLQCPAIARKVRVFWHSRSQLWPQQFWSWNGWNDLRAARVLFESNLPLVLFDTGTHLTCGMAESEARIRPHGVLGRYLHEIRQRDPLFQQDDKGLFDLGDVACLIDPGLVEGAEVDTHTVGWGGAWRPAADFGKILRIHHIAREGTLNLLFRKLAEHAPATTGCA